MSYAIPKK